MRLLLGCLTVAAAAFSVGAVGSAPPGRIVFAANRAPTWSGHVYVVHAGGRPLDLSTRSGGLDSRPAVSPDGARIAFASTRGGRLAVYTMAIDSRRPRRASPFLSVGGPNATAFVQAISWRPDGDVFSVLLGSYGSGGTRIYTATASGGWRLLVPGRAAPATLGGWSPDGGTLYYAAPQTGSAQGVDPRGKLVFDVPGDAVLVSAAGSLAVQRDSRTWVVYSANGRQLGRLPNVQTAAWSPDGTRLATLGPGGVLEVRPGGIGRPTMTSHVLAAGFLGWAGNRTLRVEGATALFGLDAASGRRVALPYVFRQLSAVSTPDGSFAAGVVFPRSSDGTRVKLVEQLGGHTRTVATFPTCGDSSVLDDLQLFGHGGLVYDTTCVAPNADVYSVAPDGSGLRQLTHSPLDDAQPAASPGGTRIAWVEKANEIHCPGCTETLWAMNVDGAGLHEFPNSPSQDLPYDESPSFSPDGKTILFVRSGPNATGLFTVPAGGGAVDDLRLAGTGAVWGPSRIAFNAWPAGTPSTVMPDGSGLARVKGAGAGGTAAWSADGRLAYLQSSPRGVLSILQPASGLRIQLPGLTTTSLGGLAWSPDGSRFAFVAADSTGVSDVWTIGVDGSKLNRVTHGLGAVTSLAWR